MIIFMMKNYPFIYFIYPLQLSEWSTIQNFANPNWTTTKSLIKLSSSQKKNNKQRLNETEPLIDICNM